MKLELFSSRTLGNCSCHCARREPILRRMLAHLHLKPSGSSWLV